MTWINGLPSDEQLLANQSRLWLEKEDDAVKKVLSLLPQAERKESGNYRNYVAKECLFEKGYDRPALKERVGLPNVHPNRRCVFSPYFV